MEVDGAVDFFAPMLNIAHHTGAALKGVLERERPAEAPAAA